MTMTDIRPVAGDIVHVVFVSGDSPGISTGSILLDRGRGIVVDLDSSSDVEWVRNTRILLVFNKNDEIYSMRGSVSEVLAPKRGYVQPTGEPVVLDKREFIRAVVRIPVVVSHGAEVTGSLHESSVELSASGFRLLTPVPADVGQRVNLVMDLGETIGVVVQPSSIIRSVERGGTYELAGQFEQTDPEVREAIARIVFHSCLVGLGLGIEAWD